MSLRRRISFVAKSRTCLVSQARTQVTRQAEAELAGDFHDARPMKARARNERAHDGHRRGAGLQDRSFAAATIGQILYRGPIEGTGDIGCDVARHRERIREARHWPAGRPSSAPPRALRVRFLRGVALKMMAGSIRAEGKRAEDVVALVRLRAGRERAVG